jgi:hypothetical protein
MSHEPCGVFYSWNNKTWIFCVLTAVKHPTAHYDLHGYCIWFDAQVSWTFYSNHCQKTRVLNRSELDAGHFFADPTGPDPSRA